MSGVKKTRRGRELARQDGREVFERHVLPLREEFHRRALRLTRDDADAEDLLQESLLKALAAVDQLEDPSRVRAWVHTIIHNTFASWCRRNASRSLVAVEPGELDAMESTAPEPRAELRFDLERAMSGLDETFREAVVLCDMQELSYQEASERMSCPTGTLMSRLHRGRRRLRDLLN
jgi:RNA polymerase sigma-70 factor (ECF subfamily)